MSVQELHPWHSKQPALAGWIARLGAVPFIAQAVFPVAIIVLPHVVEAKPNVRVDLKLATHVSALKHLPTP
jgi:hypothetical protein